jgi:hypothetical protein
MLSFLSENRVGYKVESSYEYLGTIHRNKLTLWLAGIPWHFYYVFMLVKIPVTTLLGFGAGLVLMFQKRLGDGRYFVFWYCFFWFVPFSVLGGKFTRYFVFALPVVHIISAIGISWFSGKISDLFARKGSIGLLTRNRIYATAFIIISAVPIVSALRAEPFYRLYTNAIGRAFDEPGNFFPHDEFYDARLGETAKSIAELAAPGVRVYSETPALTEYHLRREGRNDLASIWLSDPDELAKMEPGDIVIDARGRRYVSNFEMLNSLENTSAPLSSIYLGDIPAVRVFRIDEQNLSIFRR